MKKIISMKIYKTECQTCGCLFEYDKTEIVVGALKDSFTMDDLHYVECPSCKNLTKHETREHISNNEISEIAKMQQQIYTFKTSLLHASERILHGNKCGMVIIDPLDDCDKHLIKTIFKFIDEHSHAPEKDITLEDIVAPAFKNDKAALKDYCSKMNDAAKKLGIDPLNCSVEDAVKICDEFDKMKAENQTTVFDIYPQIKQSNAINIVVKSLIDDFTPDPEAELNEDDLNDIAKIFVKSRRYGYVTAIPMTANNAFRKTFIEPNLNEKGFLRQDRFATELTTENGVKYMLFFPWSKIDNQNAPYNEK